MTIAQSDRDETVDWTSHPLPRHRDELEDYAPVVGSGTADPFWEARKALQTIRQHAQARRVSPWATLGGVLARVVASTSPTVVLPPLVGGYGSLNLFVGIVAGSGGGKGTSQAAAAELLDATADTYAVVPVGSGEGIAHAYVRRAAGEDGKSGGVEQHTSSVLFDVAEVDTIAALGGRKGSTLLAELRKAWSGERLGFQNADASRRLPVEAHSYRAALVVGIQPERAGGLLDDADGGTPQRFIWLPADDPTAPDHAPAVPAGLDWDPPIVPANEHGRRVVGVCDTARAAIDHARLARLRGQVDALDAHSLFARLKVAAALMLLDGDRVGEGRGQVTEDDWTLAGRVMEMSDHTRETSRSAIAQAARRVTAARAEIDAERAVTVAERVANKDVERTANYVLRQLDKALDGMTFGELNRSAGRNRDWLPEALAMLDDASRIRSEMFTGGNGKPAMRYRLAT